MNNLIISDKFNIIKSEPEILMNTDEFVLWIEEMFTNSVDKRSNFNNSLIHQYIYNICFKDSKVNEFLDTLLNSINKQISKRTKNIIPFIKNGKFTLVDFDLMLTDFINTIDEINKTVFLVNKWYDKYFNETINKEYVKLPYGKSIIFRKSLKYLFSQFIDNFAIKQYLNSQMLLLDEKNKKHIINYNNFMLDLKIYDEKCYNFYLNNIVKNLETLFHNNDAGLAIINTSYFQEMKEFRTKSQIYEYVIEYFCFLDKELKNLLAKSLTNNLLTILIKLFSNRESPLIILDFSIKNIKNINLVFNHVYTYNNNDKEKYNCDKLHSTIDEFFNYAITYSITEYLSTPKTTNKLSKFLDCFNSINYLHDRLEKYLSIFSIKSTYTKNLGIKLNENPDLIKKICLIIHSKLKDIKINDEDVLEYCSNILKIINYDSKNKDLFQALYCKYLVQRILNNSNIQIEKKLLFQLQEIEDYNYVRKMQKMVNDIEISKDDLKNFNKIKINQNTKILPIDFKQDKLNLVTFSYNVWDIAIKTNSLDETDLNSLTPQLNTYMNTYNKFYKARYGDNRKLLWLFEMGVISLKMVILDNEYKIKATPHQTIILELFMEKNSMLINDIKNNDILKKLETDYIDQLINSLVASRIFIIKDDVLKFNNNFNAPIKEISLIDFYKNISDYEYILDKKIEKQVAFDREIVLQTNLINHLKQKTLNINELVELMKESPHIYFDVSSESVTKEVDILVKKELIVKINCNTDIDKYSYWDVSDANYPELDE